MPLTGVPLAGPAIAGFLLLAGCTQGVDERQSPPTTVTYDLTFLQTAEVVATDTVQVFVFDATQKGGDCLSLVGKRSAGTQAFSNAPLTQSAAASPCALLGGDASNAGAVVGVTYGPRSFFAIAQRQSLDFFLGCAETDVEPNVAVVSIALEPANATVVVPSTSCMSLSGKCSGQCM
jgi:hypothetical protein